MEFFHSLIFYLLTEDDPVTKHQMPSANKSGRGVRRFRMQELFYVRHRILCNVEKQRISDPKMRFRAGLHTKFKLRDTLDEKLHDYINL